MPRIGHFIRTYLPRTETFIHAIVRSHRRHEPVVFCRERTCADLFPVSALHELKGALPGATGLLADLSYRFLRHSSAAEVAWFAGRARDSGIAVMHGHFGTDARYFVPVAARTGLPLVCSFYGYDISSFPKRLAGIGRAYLQPLFRQAQAVVAISGFMAARLEDIGCPPEKLRVIHFGIELDRFPFRTVTPGEDGIVRLAHVGRLVPKKGQMVLLQALSRLPSGCPPIRCAIAGGGPLERELRQAAHALGVEDKVDFLGYLPHPGIAALMAGSHIYVQPSVTPASGDQEGTPTTLMEAMASGMPVISTRHAGIPEVIAPGYQSELVEEYDADRLAEVIATVASDPGSWAPRGLAGRAHVEDQFSSLGETAKLEALYDSLL